jgi:hypothetical protein
MAALMVAFTHRTLQQTTYAGNSTTYQLWFLLFCFQVFQSPLLTEPPTPLLPLGSVIPD